MPESKRSLLPHSRRLHADRAAFLVDADSYYTVLADVLERAQRSVFIVGWDLHTEVRLRRDGRQPDSLGAILLETVRRNRNLTVHLLLWDYALIYVFERQPLPLMSFVWLSHPRIQIRHDATLPTGASHHQKFVVVDDSLAFIGGIDLTLNRWDTREHLANDGRRSDGNRSYGPFHDVQAAVAGEVAAHLGQLARHRWKRATGTTLPAPELGAVESPGPPKLVWPDSLDPALADVEVVLASTTGSPTAGSTDIELTYLEAISSARRFIYVENQYLTSAAIGEALEASLSRPRGPEIVLVLPRDASGWLEQSTMDVLRTRLLRCLERADAHGRLGVYHPVTGSASGASIPIYVHAKVLVIDDVVARVGSSNLSNRSMGFDSECDLLVVGDTNPDARRAIATFRDSLIAEHLGQDVAEVTRCLEATGSLIRAIERLRGGDRTLLPGVTMAADWMLDALPDRTIVDPERPLELATWIEEGLPKAVRSEAEVNLKIIASLAALGAAAVCSFHASGVADLVNALELLPEVSVVLLVGYCVAVVVPVPATLLHVAAVLVDGPLVGLAVATLGSALNATLTFFAGRRLGRDTVRRWAGKNLNRVARRLAKRGALGVAVVRALPITPFSIEGLVAGASGVRVGDYILGTVLGAFPNLVVATVTVSLLRLALETPSVYTAAFAALAFGALAGAAVLLARRVNGRNRP